MNVQRYAFTTALGLAAMLPALSVHAEDAKWYDSTKVSGFVDAYYKFNGDGRKSTASNNVDSGFDSHQNQFSVGGGKMELSSMDGGAVIDFYFGDYGRLLQAAPATTYNEAAIAQAYISQPVGPVTITLGRYFTHVGYELTDSVTNWNFTRSLLFASIPFYHQGIKLAYSPMESLSLMATLDNGNSVNYTTINETGGGFQIGYTGIKDLSLYANYSMGPGTTAVYENTHYIDIIGTYGISEGITFGAEYLYFTTIADGTTNSTGNVIGTSMTDSATGKLVAYSPKTQGYALYLDYATPLEGLSITPRFEALYAPDNGGAGNGQTKFDYTLTARHTKGAIINWFEFRLDASDDAIYAGPVNDPTIAGSYTEMAFTWGVGYTF